MSGHKRNPYLLFGVACLLGIVAIAVAIYAGKTRRAADFGAAANVAGAVANPSGTSESGTIYFRYGSIGPDYGKIAHAVFDSGVVRQPMIEDIGCEVVHASGGVGICLAADRGVVTTYSAKIFSLADHRIRAELPLAGVPSRARVAASGRYAAATVFVSGHGYDSVDFSTQTIIIDLATNTLLADVEGFTFTTNGEPFSNSDFNVWGVTFAPGGDTFFATLSTQGRHLLVRGDVAKRTAAVVHDNVECPSVSPDGTHVAYKKRYVRDGRVGWNLHVLDLATLEETSLAEERSVDDQLEWLDGNTVLYSVAATGAAGTDVWRTSADGTGMPAILISAAYSPAVVR